MRKLRFKGHPFPLGPFCAKSRQMYKVPGMAKMVQNECSRSTVLRAAFGPARRTPANAKLKPAAPQAQGILKLVLLKFLAEA